MSNKMYDILKWLAMMVLPALAILVRTLFGIWNIPFGAEISDTIVAVNAFLGAILGLSNTAYKNKRK